MADKQKSQILAEGRALEGAIADAAHAETWAFADWLLATFGPPVKGRPIKGRAPALTLPQYSQHSRFSYRWLKELRQMAHQTPEEERIASVSDARDRKAGRRTRKQRHAAAKLAAPSKAATPALAMRKEAPPEPDPEISKPLRFPEAIDMRNAVLGVAALFKLDPLHDAHALHEQFKFAAKSHCGWIETGGANGTDVRAVYDECCAQLRTMFGI
jgi:hypothetical protein